MTEARYSLTAHATERIRQRVGINSVETAIAWASDNIAKATRTYKVEHKTHYVTNLFEIVCDGFRVITVKPTENVNDYAAKFSGLLTKEVSKLTALHSKELRKAEIKVAEHTLSFLKARNPQTKAIIQAKLTVAIDEKQRVADELKAISLAANRYGIEV